MTEDIKKVVWPAALVILLVLFAGFWIVTASVNSKIDSTASAKTDLSQVASKSDVSNLAAGLAELKADVAASKNTETSTETSSGVPAGSYMLTKAEYEEKLTEEKALELATAYVNSKDFKELFEDVLWDGNNNDDNNVPPLFMREVGIEDYKDITSVKVIESEFDEVDKVTFEMKVYFNVDGDEEDKAYLVVEGLEVTVNDLEVDDEFADAEVDELDPSDVQDAMVKVKYLD